MDLKTVITEFTERLHAVIEAHSLEQARAAVMRALGVNAPRKPGRPAKASQALPSAAAKPRKKPPRQFCPVPGCKNVAAPVFGMVCANHKDVAKSKIKKFREARKAKKLGVKVVAKKSVRKASKKRPSKPAVAAAKRAPKAKPKRLPPSSAPKVETEAVPTTPAAA